MTTHGSHGGRMRPPAARGVGGGPLAGLRTAAALCLLAAPAAAGPSSVGAQSPNLHLPVDSVEHLLDEAPFPFPDELVDTRWEGDRTQRVTLRFADGAELPVKWAPAPEGGETFNNAPRYELAAWEIQKLFLEPGEYVVPPVAVRAVPLSAYRDRRDEVPPTFEGTGSVLVALQYFLSDVTEEGVFDRERFETDTVYARAWGRANLLTYLISHNDSNEGNLLISTDPDRPRVYAVDNGLAFESPWSNRGTRWRVLQVDRYPAPVVERLRAIEEGELRRHLGVLVQFEVRDGALVTVERGPNVDPEAGVRRREGTIQIGLTSSEIDGVWTRLRDFLHTVDEGRMKVF